MNASFRTVVITAGIERDAISGEFTEIFNSTGDPFFPKLGGGYAGI